jgi:hypothetical protein
MNLILNEERVLLFNATNTRQPPVGRFFRVRMGCRADGVKVHGDLNDEAAVIRSHRSRCVLVSWPAGGTAGPAIPQFPIIHGYWVSGSLDL